MKKFLVLGLVLLSFTGIFAICQGKYIITIDGQGAKCANDCADAKSIAANALMNGAKQVRIDCREWTVNKSCDGKTYTSASQIH